MHFTGSQLYRGLAGFYLIRDDIEDRLPLPRGKREIPLMIADRAFTKDGSLFYPSKDPSLRTWRWTRRCTGCGSSTPQIARPYELVLDPPPPGGRGFVQIGSDAGLLPRPVRHDAFLMSPGERYDVLIDFAAYPPGVQVLLKNTLGEGPTA